MHTSVGDRWRNTAITLIDRDCEMFLLYPLANMKKVGNSWLSDLIGAIITVRVVILTFFAVLAFFVTFPPALLVLLVLGLIYSIYRIIKDLKTVRSNKLT